MVLAVLRAGSGQDQWQPIISLPSACHRHPVAAIWNTPAQAIEIGTPAESHRPTVHEAR